MPYTPWFPDPGTFVKYFDEKKKEYRFRKLLWRRDPLVYPRRLPAVAAGSKGEPLIFEEINPSKDKDHIYLAYLGVAPGFLYYLWHPYNVKNLLWDERIADIDDDLTAWISYEESPYEYPTKYIGIDHDRYPSIEALNISGSSAHPAVIWVASLYKMVDHEDLSDSERAKLQSGDMRSYPWDFGGEL